MTVCHLELLDPEEEDTMLLEKAGNHTPNKTASCSGSLESSSYPEFSTFSCSK